MFSSEHSPPCSVTIALHVCVLGRGSRKRERQSESGEEGAAKREWGRGSKGWGREAEGAEGTGGRGSGEERAGGEERGDGSGGLEESGWGGAGVKWGIGKRWGSGAVCSSFWPESLEATQNLQSVPFREGEVWASRSLDWHWLQHLESSLTRQRQCCLLFLRLG